MSRKKSYTRVFTGLSISPDFQKEIFNKEILVDNFRRLLPFSIFIFIFCFAHFILSIANQPFYKFQSITLTIGFIIIVASGILIINSLRNNRAAKNNKKKQSRSIFFYFLISIALCWSAVVSAFELDTFFGYKSYLILLFTISALFYFQAKVIFALFTVSLVILIFSFHIQQIGLTISNGYFSTLMLLLPIAWIISRILFYERIKNFEKSIKLIEAKNNLKNKIISRTQKIHSINLKLEKEIAERRKYEAELEIAKNKAEEADKLKTAFLANMSHEIRTPMNAIVGFSQLLRGGNMEKNKELFIDIINSNSVQLLTIIDDIIEISKIESEQVEVNIKEFCLNDLIRELHETHDGQCKNIYKKNISIRYQITLPDGEDAIYSDDIKITQILSNLINNALKFTNEGKIEFGYDKVGKNSIRFFVHDTGIGLTAQEKIYIFERFRQADESSSRIYGGFGLGLAISKGLVNYLNGEIWVESEPGEGATFYFTIPYKPGSIKKSIILNTSPKKSVGSSLSLKNRSILIVEDDPSNAMYLREVLKPTSADIILAQNGQQAIEICKKNKNLCLILMDINLNGINGYETTKKIRKFRHDIPVIAQTANALSGDKQKSIDAGCTDYISKPIDPQDLIQIIRKHTV